MMSGYPPEPSGLNVSDNDLAQFCFHLFKLGHNTKEIAVILHISEARAYNLLSEARGHEFDSKTE